MRRGFSLIEVMIATVIIAFVGLTLLQMGTRHQKMDGYIERKSEIANYLSIAAFHHDPTFNKLEKSPYDYLETSYTIEHMEIKRLLKRPLFYYVQDEVSTIDFGDDTLSDEESDGMERDTQRESQRFSIYRGTIRQESASASFFFIQPK